MPDPLRRRVRPLPPSPYGENAVEVLRQAARRQDASPLVEAILAEGDLASFLGTALGDCPYLLDLAAKDVSRLAAILDEPPEGRIAALNAQLGAAEWDTRQEAMRGLR